MLTFLKVTNFALIDKLELDFKSGFNVLTGETGAGKSIIIKAVQLLLGDRTNSDFIRQGATQAEVHAIFSLTENLKNLLNQNGLPSDDSDVIIRRVIGSNGSKNFINGVPVSLQVLKTFMTQVVNICGQHEHQLLVNPDDQLKLVDDFGDNEQDLIELSKLFSLLKENKKQTDSLTSNQDIKEQRLDYLKYQLSEITQVNPQLDEESELQSKEGKILGLQDLLQVCQMAESTFYGEEGSVISPLESFVKKLKSGLKHDPALQDQVDKIDGLLNQLEELGQFFSGYLKKNNLDDQDLDYVINRLESFKKLKRKYGGTIESVILKQTELEKEKKELENSDQRLAELAVEKKDLLNKYYKISKKLNESRLKVAETLSKQVSLELQELKMSGSEFKIQVNKLPTLTSKGQDEIVFLIAPNKGEGLKPLSKIASGGELSRIMLALTKVITTKIPLSLYIFDEIDAGIGGETGLVVGQKLNEISSRQQTICITHLPQVAVFADEHFVISKGETNSRVSSNVEMLSSEKQKQSEIARMLGGNMVKNQALDHAAAMIKQAFKLKKI